MACCGEKRRALSAASAAGSSRAATVAVRTTPREQREPWRTADVMLRYRGAAAFATRSARTGRAYSCSGANAALMVDPRDFEMLLLTRLFVRP